MQTDLEQPNFEPYLYELEKALGSLSDAEREERHEEMRQHLMGIYAEARLLGESEETAIQKAITQFGQTGSLQQLTQEEQIIVRKTNNQDILIGTLMGMPFIALASFYAESLSVKYYAFFGLAPKSTIAVLVYLLLISCFSGILHAISMTLSEKSRMQNKLSAFLYSMAMLPALLISPVLGKNIGISLLWVIFFAIQMAFFIKIFHQGLQKFSRQIA
jgi:preprotein translocase subunit SecE